MHVTSIPVIDQLIAERRVTTGYPRDHLTIRIIELEDQLSWFEEQGSDHVCCCCGTC